MTKRLLLLGIASLMALATVPVKAQDSYPSKPVRIVVGYAAGGATDNLARFLSVHLAKKLNQSFIVDNKPGGGTVIAAQSLLSAPADGYTIAVLEPTTTSVAPFLFKKTPYDSKQIQPITRLVDIPLGLAVPTDSRFRSLKDFIAETKAKPGLPFGSPGSTSVAYLLFEEFLQDAGLKLTHSAYKGAAPAVQDLIGGHLEAAAIDMASGVQHVHAGKIKVLAVATPQRLEALPNVPTYKELGFPRQDVAPWFGVFTKAGTPRPVIDKLNTVLQEIANSQEFRDWTKAQTLIVSLTKSPEEFEAVVKANTDVYSKTVKRLGLSLD
jgi:tripartite-type tricarboxylate transporter receptor subunit TctC